MFIDHILGSIFLFKNSSYYVLLLSLNSSPSSLFFVVCCLLFAAVFSRMRSEGFPFIVGVWGWTCVRFVLLPRRRVVVDSSSCRRRLVVASSSRRRRQLVNFSLLGGTFALRHHPVFQSMKSEGSLA